MIEKIGRKPFNVFAFDVESHNDDESQNKEETSIWLSSFIDETSNAEDEKNYFYDVKSFLNHLETISELKWRDHKRNNPNILIYVYNLSFEYSFLLPVLFKVKGVTSNNKI